MTLQYLKDNLDSAYQSANEVNKKFGIAAFASKYILLGVAKSVISGFGFKDMFEYNRDLPKVLKCFIMGRKDLAIPERLLNEKAIYYCYQHQLDDLYH
jgi:hypothetical protein